MRRDSIAQRAQEFAFNCENLLAVADEVEILSHARLTVDD